jgi:hypothetical protein
VAVHTGPVYWAIGMLVLVAQVIEGPALMDYINDPVWWPRSA